MNSLKCSYAPLVESGMDCLIHKKVSFSLSLLWACDECSLMVSQSCGTDTLISACFDSAAAAVRGQIAFTTDPLFQTGKAAANELAFVCSNRV